jgi:hypothetical protein
MKVRFNAVDNHGAKRLFWKIVETQADNLSLECGLKNIRAFARLLPVHPGLLQLVQKVGHEFYFSPLARRSSIVWLTPGFARLDAAMAFS